VSGPVSPETRLGPLLDEHPELEEVLIGLSPEFVRLRNPILRRTVARIATVAQAAKIGGLAVPDLVRALRRALGQEDAGGTCGHEAPDAPAGPEPSWVGAVAPAEVLDADAILARGGTPVGEASARLAEAAPGAVLLLKAPFYPAPLVDALRAKGHEVYAREAGGGSWEVLLRRSR
jgi:hypothetical protein